MNEMNVFVITLDVFVILEIGGQVKHIACWDASHSVLFWSLCSLVNAVGCFGFNAENLLCTLHAKER